MVANLGGIDTIMNDNPCKECIVTAMCKKPCNDFILFIDRWFISYVMTVQIATLIRLGSYRVEEDNINITNTNGEVIFARLGVEI